MRRTVEDNAILEPFLSEDAGQEGGGELIGDELTSIHEDLGGEWVISGPRRDM